MKDDRESGGALVFKYFFKHFDLAQDACFHIENYATHGDVFGNPRMRPDFLDLLPGILLRVLVSEESHRSRRRMPGRSAQLRVKRLICECGEPAAGVVEKQYLSASEDTVGNNNFRENIFCYSGSAGPDNIDIGFWQPQDCRKVRETRIHAGNNYDFGGWMLPKGRIVTLRIVAVRFQRLIDNTHHLSPNGRRCGQARSCSVALPAESVATGRLHPRVTERINWTIVSSIPWY